MKQKPTDTTTPTARAAATAQPVPVSFTCRAIDRRRAPERHWFAVHGGLLLVAISEAARKDAAEGKLTLTGDPNHWSQEQHRISPSDQARVIAMATTANSTTTTPAAASAAKPIVKAAPTQPQATSKPATAARAAATAAHETARKNAQES